AVEKRADPRVLVPGARSAVVVTANYYPGEEEAGTTDDPSRGVFARYARNDDYHELLKRRLIALQNRIAEELIPAGGRAYVDSGLVLGLEQAVRSTLGWLGRISTLIQHGRVSFSYPGSAPRDVRLPYAAPFARQHCGGGERCVVACPTCAPLERDAAG